MTTSIIVAAALISLGVLMLAITRISRARFTACHACRGTGIIVSDYDDYLYVSGFAGPDGQTCRKCQGTGYRTREAAH